MAREKIQLYRDYYILLNDGQEVKDYKETYGKQTTWHTVYDGDVVKVLGPVPTFAELQLLKENLRNAIKENDTLTAQLMKGFYNERD